MANWISHIAIDELIDETLDHERILSQPSRLCGRTRYFFSPAEEKEIFILNRHPSIQDEDKNSSSNFAAHFRAASSQPLSYSSWNEKIEPVRKALRDPTFDDIVKRAWERPRSTDGSEAQLTTAAALAKKYVRPEFLKSIDMTKVLGTCRNLSAARVMLSYPGIELDAVSTANPTTTTAGSAEEQEYVPIVRTSGNGWLVKPVLPLCNPSEELFSDTDKYSRQRFDIVCGVANALCVAAGAGWPHRRLSTASILVHRNWAGDQESENKAPNRPTPLSTDGIEHCVKVTGFRCPVSKGCLNGCNICKQFFQFQKQDHGKDYITKLYEKKADDEILFAGAFGTGYNSVENGETSDAVAFASFVLWLYSGVSITNPRKDGKETKAEKENEQSHLSRVPWPIRYIVMDALSEERTERRISLVNTVDYLHALRERAVNPHLLNVLFMPRTSPLFPVGLHATLSAARCDEPQAMIQLGRMCERIASDQNEVSDAGNSRITNGNRNRLRIRQPVSRHDLNMGHTAYGLYAAAARHGEVAAFLHMANILAEWIDGRWPHPLPNVVQLRLNRIQLLRCVLRAALEGTETVMEDAISIMERFGWSEKKKKEWNSVRMLLKADPDANDIDKERGSIDDLGDVGLESNMTGLSNSNATHVHGGVDGENHTDTSPDRLHRVLMKAVTVGQSLRRGAYGLPCNIRESRSWLSFVIQCGRERSAARSAAELELGLIERQLSESAEGMTHGVALVRNACNSVDGRVSCNAKFWLGLWYHKGLKFSSTTMPGDDQEVHQIVPENNVFAAKLFLESASGKVPNKEAMAYYSKFVKEGLGDVEVNPRLANVWNRRARKAGSISAMVQYGFALEEDAQLVYAARPRSWGSITHGVTRTSRSNSRAPSQDRNSRNMRADGTAVARSRTSDGSYGTGLTGTTWNAHGPSFRPEAVLVNSTGNGLVVSIQMSHGTERFESDEAMLDMVDLKLLRARRLLNHDLERLCDEDGEQGMSPLGYWLWGRILASNVKMWSECAAEVRNTGGGRMGWMRTGDRRRANFEQMYMKEALQSLRVAAGMDKDKRWSQHRVNYIEHDQKWMGVAESKIRKLQPS